MQSTFPKYVIGTSVFFDAITRADSAAHQHIKFYWRNLRREGVTISVASLVKVWATFERFAVSKSAVGLLKPFVETFHLARTQFERQGCLIPVTHETVLWSKQRLVGSIRYRDGQGGTAEICELEKLVVATALAGFEHRDITLVEYSQPGLVSISNRVPELKVSHIATPPSSSLPDILERMSKGLHGAGR